MSSNKIHAILGDVEGFLERIFAGLEHLKLDVTPFELDHICLRVETLEDYEGKKAQLGTLAKLLIESEVNGRPIATFRLDEAVEFRGRKIFVVEIPAPKANRPKPAGLEHVEFVLPMGFEPFLKKYAHLKFDTRALGKGLNPEIELSLGELAVKFHLLPLERVIEIEKELATRE